jgi:hypothetical protein
MFAGDGELFQSGRGGVGEEPGGDPCVVFRVGAEWIADKEGLTDSNLTWIGIGYGVSDLGALLLIISLIIGGVSVRRMNRGKTPSPVAARIVTGLVSLVLIAYLVAVWAMTTKPT